MGLVCNPKHGNQNVSWQICSAIDLFLKQTRDGPAVVNECSSMKPQCDDDSGMNESISHVTSAGTNYYHGEDQILPTDTTTTEELYDTVSEFNKEIERWKGEK
eukprot:8186114-Lingulodinium_polyedra.AAC.1